MPERNEPFERLLTDIFINSTLEEDYEDEIVRTAQELVGALPEGRADAEGVLGAIARRLRSGRCGREPPCTVEFTAAPRSPEELAEIIDNARNAHNYNTDK